MSISNLGHMRFKRQLTPLEEDIVKEINLEYTVELDDWWFAEGQFGYYNCNLIFQVCQEITATKIDFHDNERATIIQEISHIGFPNLISLHLSSNNIESLEHLPFLKAQNLQRLFLNGNNITEAKSLRKCNFPNLTMLSLSDNKIVDISFFAQCSFIKTIKTLDLQQVDTSIRIENISSVLKLKSDVLREICKINVIKAGASIDRQCIKFLEEFSGRDFRISNEMFCY